MGSSSTILPEFRGQELRRLTTSRGRLGAPDFFEADYWDELCQHRLVAEQCSAPCSLCWGAMAGFQYLYGIQAEAPAACSLLAFFLSAPARDECQLHHQTGSTRVHQQAAPCHAAIECGGAAPPSLKLGAGSSRRGFESTTPAIIATARDFYEVGTLGI